MFHILQTSEGMYVCMYVVKDFYKPMTFSSFASLYPAVRSLHIRF